MLEENCTALVTAHHADDQAETIFMRILRGSRLFHISGMKEKQKFANGELIRPLLSFQNQISLLFFILKIGQIKRTIIYVIEFEMSIFRC